MSKIDEREAQIAIIKYCYKCSSKVKRNPTACPFKKCAFWRLRPHTKECKKWLGIK